MDSSPELIKKIQKSCTKRPKGRPSGNYRFKEPLKISTNSNKMTNRETQNKCGSCNNIRHKSFYLMMDKKIGLLL